MRLKSSGSPDFRMHSISGDMEREKNDAIVDVLLIPKYCQNPYAEVAYDEIFSESAPWVLGYEE